uniref:Coatomer subunit delta n=2 Tax=Alexandrium monilatum TaxID=311494 RepID=A0A6T1LR22_9DINO|mmetsp:Transcript_10126/g.30330  ORF Transcript_10126/g.30330 Transcript_10126/m.30330 type:complete len:522 (+) Transcript_10126:102-1667(+)
MVVLSAAIVTSGKTLVARQFVEMTRLRVEGLMSAFSKLVDSGRDHTFIETESVRYIYQPMESLYLVLVTNKASNILEDLETLRLLAKVVQDCCQIQVNEEYVLKNAFDIVFAFDEVISFGHRESVTLSQIKTYTEMDSHEEKLHQMIEQSKINEAKETAKRKQLELAKQRANAPKDSTPTGISGGDNPTSMSSMSSMSFKDTAISSVTMESSPSPPWNALMSDDGPAMLKPGAPKKGMALSKKKPGDALAALGIAEPAPGQSEVEEKPELAAAPVVNPLLDPVKVDIEEKITADMQVEGGLSGEAVCTGQFQVTVLDVAKADLVCFKLAPQNQEFKYKVHPNLNKASHANDILEVKDPARAFRANAPAPLLKWQFKSSDDAFLPVSLSCWPTATADGTQIVLELELTDDSVTLEDVHIRFPAAPSSRPSISSAEPGEAVYDPGTQQVHWQIPQVDKSENTGTLEFSASADTASLLPFTFEAVRRGQTRCPMEILECYHQARKDAISFALDKCSIYELRIGV